MFEDLSSNLNGRIGFFGKSYSETDTETRSYTKREHERLIATEKFPCVVTVDGVNRNGLGTGKIKFTRGQR